MEMAEVDQISRSIGELTQGFEAVKREVHFGFDSVNRQITDMRNERATDISRIWDRIMKQDDTIMAHSQDIANAKTTLRNIKIFFAIVLSGLSAYALFNQSFKIASVNHLPIAMDDK